MLNQFVVVGRLAKDIEVNQTENGTSATTITLAVPRTYKNKDGVYDTDFVDITLFDGIAKNTAEYCKKGDLLGVKGRVKTDIYEKDGKSIKTSTLVAEKISFLAAKKNDKEEVKEDSKEQDLEMQ